MSASVYSMEMKVFVYANVGWAMGGKEALLDGLASSMRHGDGERGWAPRCVRVGTEGGGRGGQ